MIRKALIPAAGQGMRAYPKTRWIPKPLLEVGGRSLIERNLRILRRELGVEEAVIIAGHLGDQLREALGDGRQLGLKIQWVDCPEPSIGLAQGMLLAEPQFDEPFVMMLADELYLHGNHGELTVPERDFLAVCAVRHTPDKRLIEKNYSVQIEADRIVDLVEKPSQPTSHWLGCGTYLFSQQIFDRIREASPSPRSGKVELMEVIGAAARAGAPVHAFLLGGEYINVNSVEDYNTANYLARSLAFEETRVSVVVPTYQEEASIASVVRDFVAHPRVDEVLVVDNSSTDETVARAADAGARVEVVERQGYGDTIAWGLDHAVGDLLLVVEADHSFRAKDVGKLLEYLKDADMVIGTRTTREMVEQGTNMIGMVRWANVVVGKLIELLWWRSGARYTDVGCTYRGIWKDVWLQMRERVHGVGPEFSPEMMIEVLRARKRVIEVPVSYYPRTGGESKHSKSLRHLTRTALRMLRLILSRRLGLDPRPHS